jgi:anti-sigma-K factor RskA
MIDDRQEELASLHALGLLEGAELEQFHAELSGNAELRGRVAELRVAATALAHAAPEATPPEALKARILASAAARGARQAGVPRETKVVRFPAWIPWAVAAGLGIAVAWTGRRYSEERDANAALAEQQRIAQKTLDETRDQLADAKRLATMYDNEVAELTVKLRQQGDLAHFRIATLASMLGNSPAALAVAVWDPSREQGVLEVSKLPALATEKDYQLWVIDNQYPAPVSAGVFVVDPATGEAHIVFKAAKPVGSIAKFAVSLERKGGSPSPEGPIVLISQ